MSISSAADRLRDSPARRRFAAMYGTGGAGNDRAMPQVPYIEDEQQKSDMLGALARGTVGTVETLGKIFDYPGAIARGILAGDPASGFSWDYDRRVSGKELLEKYGLLSKDANPYYSTAAGLAAEVLTDPLAIITGPTKSLTMAGRAAAQTGLLDNIGNVAVRKLAPGASSFAEAAEKIAATTRTGRNAYRFLGNILPAGKGITEASAAVRPLVGKRVAQSVTTLEDAVKASSDPTTARTAVENYLKQRNIDYDSVKGDTLGGAFGLQYFGLVDPVVFNPSAARSTLDYLDALGQSVRWSSPVRRASQFFSKKTSGEYDAVEQLFAMRRNEMVDAEKAVARVKGAENARLVASLQLGEEAKKLLGADSLNTPRGRDFLTRLYEGTFTQSDQKIVRAIGPGINRIVSNWDTLRTEIADDAAELGIYSAKLTDRFGGKWSPRVAREANFGEYGKGLSRATNTAKMTEQEARATYLELPGVTVDLREVSTLPKVQQFVREGADGSMSIEELGAAIKQYIDAKHGPNAADPRVIPFKTFVPKLGPDGKPIMEPVLLKDGTPAMRTVKTKRGTVVLDKATGKPKMVPRMRPVYDPTQVVSQRQAEGIARFVGLRRDKNTPLDIPMFSEHPVESQARALQSQATARAHTRFVYESLGEAAVAAAPGQLANSVKGVGWMPLGKAVDEIAKKVGLTLGAVKTAGSKKVIGASKTVRENVMRAIAKSQGIQQWNTIDLNRYALPESVFNRLTRMNDFYNSPRAQEEVITFFDKISQLFKGFALAFPATKVRDMYSNSFLLTLEAGNVIDVYKGLQTAKAIMGGKHEEAAALLKEVPGYNLADAGAIQKKLVEDVARTGILQSLASNDLLVANQTGLINQLVPGSQPLTKYGFLKEFIPDGSRSPAQMLSDQFTIRNVKFPWQAQAGFETRNAMLNASQQFSDYTDSVARLGGMIALMRQGITPDVAAKRITSALVDYNSLTMLERQTLRRLLPWYAYTSRIGKYVVQQLAQNPGGGYAQTIRAMNTLQASDEDTYIPEALRQQFAFRVPEALKPYLGIDDSGGTTTFFRDIDIPGVDTLNLLALRPTLLGSVQGTLSNLAQQANPLARSVLELTTGIDSFSKRPLEQAVTPLDRIYKRVTGSETSMNPLLRQAINVVPGPWQRVLNVAGGLADERIPMRQRIAKQAFNSIAGVKLQTVDPEWQLQDARRQLGQRLGGFMQDYTESYIPERVLPQVPPELLPDYALFRTLGRDLREARK